MCPHSYSFGMEMEDINLILRDATENSLVMVDELGRGTEPDSGAALAGAGERIKG